MTPLLPSLSPSLLQDNLFHVRRPPAGLHEICCRRKLYRSNLSPRQTITNECQGSLCCLAEPRTSPRVTDRLLRKVLHLPPLPSPHKKRKNMKASRHSFRLALLLPTGEYLRGDNSVWAGEVILLCHQDQWVYFPCWLMYWVRRNRRYLGPVKIYQRM